MNRLPLISSAHVARPALVLVAIGADEMIDGLPESLARCGLRVLCVGDGQLVLRHHLSLRPDLVLLDMQLPQLDAWRVLVELRRRGDIPVILLSDQPQDRLASLRMGADDYLAKPCDPSEVAARARAVLRRYGNHGLVGMQDEPQVLRAGPLQIDFDSYQVTALVDGVAHALALTLVEFKLLAHLARAPRRVVSRAELQQACLPEGDSLERSVDSHISRLRKKLERAGVAGMPVAVRGVGYKLSG